ADAGELAAEAVEPVPPPTEDVAPPEEVAAVVEPVRQEPAVRPQASPERQKQTPRKKKAPASPQPRAAAPAKPSPVVPATPAGGGGSAAGKSQRPAAISGAALGNYKGRVLAHLARHKRYPAEARRARLRGSVLVAFSIDNAGRVLSVRLAKASGHPPLDAEATAMVRRASPFPAIPAGASKKSMSFTTRVEFK
ncbi:MAG TPA: energy transducer TonB, partial [Kaistiaceae bacterium]|nr:energy transducer TonB [Kaistiaceae bacterium]